MWGSEKALAACVQSSWETTRRKQQRKKSYWWYFRFPMIFHFMMAECCWSAFNLATFLSELNKFSQIIEDQKIFTLEVTWSLKRFHLLRHTFGKHVNHIDIQMKISFPFIFFSLYEVFCYLPSGQKLLPSSKMFSFVPSFYFFAFCFVCSQEVSREGLFQKKVAVLYVIRSFNASSFASSSSSISNRAFTLTFAQKNWFPKWSKLFFA